MASSPPRAQAASAADRKPRSKPTPPAQAASAETAAGNGKKPKMVRDSFTMPKAEYAAIDVLKARGLALGRSVKKSELLRAGLQLLGQLDDTRLQEVLAAVPPLKTGRPKQAKAPAAAPTPQPAARKARKPAAGAPATIAAEKPPRKAKPADAEAPVAEASAPAAKARKKA